MKLATMKRQQGATLLELVMAIGLIAIISIAALSFFNNASESQKSNETVRDLGALTASVRNQFASQGNYTGITAEAVKKGNGFPKNMDADPNDPGDTWIRHNWALDGVEVTSAQATYLDDSFILTVKDLPEGACADIVTRMLPEYDLVSVNTNDVTDAAAALIECNDALANVVTLQAR